MQTRGRSVRRPNMQRLIWVAAIAALGACGTVNSVAPDTQYSALSASPREAESDLLNSVVPQVDHHKHLMGPAITEIASGEPIAPQIEVPTDIARLLRARETAWNDQEALLSVFSESAVVLGYDRAGWISGSGQVAEALSRMFGQPYSIQPAYYERSGDTARLAGYYTRGDSSGRQYLGYLHISLIRQGGRWKIAAEVPRFPVAPEYQVKTAEQLIAEMDDSGVRRAIVLSTAGWADGPNSQIEDPYSVVKAENDWTANEVSRFPTRLIAFCSFNPVADHALLELTRCAANPLFKGLKFSFAESGVDLRNADHVVRLQSVFSAANAQKMPIVLHARGGPEYGAEHVEILVRDILAYSPDIMVQIAHLWGGEAYSKPALEAFANAVMGGLPQTRNLYFDLSEITANVAATSSRATQQEIAGQMRRIGMDRLLFGSDNQNASLSWRSLVAFIPLHESELRAIARNVAPYLRD
jgi:predicted TIM-barrel fold metal-dependent hydrolase